MGAWLDQLSSGLLHWPAEYEESNPFARSVEGKFIWGHAVVYDLIMFSLLASIALVVYFGLRRHMKKYAELPGVALFLYYGIDRYLAAISNLWVTLSWMHPK